jgi:hypothetical protein
VTGNCTYDTDTLTGTAGCGLNFATKTASAQVTLSDGRTAALLMADSVSLSSGAKLSIAGRRPLILVSNGKVEVNGTIVAAASSTNAWWGGGGPGLESGDRNGICPLDGAPGGGRMGTSNVQGAGAGGGGFCGPGGAGSAHADASAPAMGGVPYGNTDLIPLVGGSSGGSALGGFTAAYGTNHGGGAIQVVSGTSILIGELGIINMGGGTPVSVAKAIAGGGGGSGGAILLEAPAVTVNGVLAANGGAGGGGYLQSGQEGQPSGAPATGGGVAGHGSSAADASGASARDPGTGTAGGGGGGAGRIRINTGCGGTFTIGGSGIVSPNATTGCFTTGQLH